MLPILARALEVRRLRMENVRLRQYVERLTFESPRYQMIGSGPAMQRVVQMIEKVAPTDATVLVRGPSGTGKELVARAIALQQPASGSAHGHDQLRLPCRKPCWRANCSATKKAPSPGRNCAKPGLIEVAEGGTLFIDEVAEMSPSLQAKLLRVLEDGHYRRVGSTKESHANVRVIAATNKPLEEEQKAGRFREDLFYRLNVVTIDLPPLRDRREDIPALVEHLLTTRQLGAKRWSVAPDALRALHDYGWPGNIRELANVIERAQILAENNLITLDDLPDALHSLLSVPSDVGPLNLSELERRTTQDAMTQAHGNKVSAARALGISRRCCIG